ncbi:MAG: hypothetical protein K1060chlam2_00648 [Chlamydiae bacterium]|nr:hypothetical protein [Chlamydiota bacterium]
MDLELIYTSLWPLRLFVIAYAFFSIPRSILPIKKGWREENPKLLSKGVSYLLTGIFCVIIFFIYFPK